MNNKKDGSKMSLLAFALSFNASPLNVGLQAHHKRLNERFDDDRGKSKGKVANSDKKKKRKASQKSKRKNRR